MRKTQLGRAATIGIGLLLVSVTTAIVPGGSAWARTSVIALSRSKNKSCSATIGDVGPFTGTVAALGQEQLDFAKLALKDFNAKYHTHLHLLTEDTQFVPSITVTKVQELISNSSVVAIQGPAASAGDDAAGPELKRAGLAAVSPSGGAGTVHVKGFKYKEANPYPTEFSVVPQGVTEGPAVGGWLVKKLHAKRVYLIDTGANFAIEFVQTIEGYLSAHHIPFASTVVSPTQTSFSSVISKIPAGTDYVYLGLTTASEGELFGQQLQQAGRTTIKIFGADGLFAPTTFKINGSYISAFAPTIRQIRADKSIVKQADRLYGTNWGTYGPPSYEAMWILANAVYNVCRSGKTPTRSNVLAQVRKTHEKTSILGRPISFNKLGYLKHPTKWIFKIENGKYVDLGEAS